MSISYELALELQEAGWPQDVGMRPVSSEKLNTYSELLEAEKEPVFPTLSQLIEACGDRFHSLGLRLPKGNKPVPKWHVASQTPASFTHEAMADTPEEAVARLWLALNKKDNS
jgi:hypothetical protein